MATVTASAAAFITPTSRPLANFHPNVWGDHFLHYTPESNEDRDKQAIEELKEEVRGELKEASNVRQLKMVDAIQRLGVEYQFEEEIDEVLLSLSEKFHDYCKHKYDIYATALGFRLLRQHGYRVSCEIFEKYKVDGEGGFRVSGDDENISGVLELYEATYLRVHGEQLLDDALVFTKNLLQSVLSGLSGPLAQQVHHALREHSIRRGLTRVEARRYMTIYTQYPSHHQGLFTLAKLDFNLVQVMHKKELSDELLSLDMSILINLLDALTRVVYTTSRWWKRFDVSTKLSFARDRLVETYYWVMAVYFEPKYALSRMISTKVHCRL